MATWRSTLKKQYGAQKCTPWKLDIEISLVIIKEM